MRHREAASSGGAMLMRGVRAALGRRVRQVEVGLVLAAILAIGGTLVARSAHAATLSVCPSSCTYTSINAAITAAAAGDVITVGAGTYGPGTGDAQIVINKAITLQGAGVGQSIINGAPAAGNSITGLVTVSNPGGSVSISGFTLEGAINQDTNDDGILLWVHDTGAADTITVANNRFYGDTTLDPWLMLDQTDSIYVSGSNATVTVNHNTFTGVFRAALIEANPGPVNFTNNDLNGLHGLYDDLSLVQLDYWAEGMFFLSDGDFNVTSPQVISGNTFRNYSGLGVGMDGGYQNCCGNYVGALSNMTVSANTFNLGGVAQAGPSHSNPPPAESAAILMHVFPFSDTTLTSSISGVSIADNIFDISSSTGHGYAIRMTGNLGSGISIQHNVLRGSGSSRPLGGVQLVNAAGTSSVSITNNIVTGFATGLDSDTLPTGASLIAHQNCIFSNATHGASNGAGASVNDQSNWWGAASGPNPPGSGDAITSNVDASSFLTSPAAICAGPVASALATNPGTLNSASGFLFTASLSDVTTGGFSIASGQYRVDGGAWSAMSAGDATFDQVTEAVKVSAGALSAGIHTLCVRGTDAQGNLGAAVCMRVNVLVGVPGADVAGPAAGGVPPSTNGASANSTSSDTASAPGTNTIGAPGPTGATAPAPHPARAKAAFQVDYPVMGLGLLLLLAGVSGLGVLLFRLRAQVQR